MGRHDDGRARAWRRIDDQLDRHVARVVQRESAIRLTHARKCTAHVVRRPAAADAPAGRSSGNGGDSPERARPTPPPAAPAPAVPAPRSSRRTRGAARRARPGPANSSGSPPRADRQERRQPARLGRRPDQADQHAGQSVAAGRPHQQVRHQQPGLPGARLRIATHQPARHRRAAPARSPRRSASSSQPSAVSQPSPWRGRRVPARQQRVERLAAQAQPCRAVPASSPSRRRLRPAARPAPAGAPRTGPPADPAAPRSRTHPAGPARQPGRHPPRRRGRRRPARPRRGRGSGPRCPAAPRPSVSSTRSACASSAVTTPRRYSASTSAGAARSPRRVKIACSGASSAISRSSWPARSPYCPSSESTTRGRRSPSRKPDRSAFASSQSSARSAPGPSRPARCKPSPGGPRHHLFDGRRPVAVRPPDAGHHPARHLVVAEEVDQRLRIERPSLLADHRLEVLERDVDAGQDRSILQQARVQQRIAVAVAAGGESDVLDRERHDNLLVLGSGCDSPCTPLPPLAARERG